MAGMTGKGRWPGLTTLRVFLLQAGSSLRAKQLCFLLIFSLSLQASGEPLQVVGDSVSLDQEVRAIKKEVLELNRELLQLEEELLYPRAEQLVIYVSVTKDEPVVLDSLLIELNGREITRHHYNDSQNRALGQGGVHRPYIGTLKAGDHSIAVSVSCYGPDGQIVQRSLANVIAKTGGPKYLELRIGRSGFRKDPTLEILEW